MNSPAPLDLSYEELRSVVIETLKTATGGQFNDLRVAVADTAYRMGLLIEPTQQTGYRVERHGGSLSGFVLADRDYSRTQTIMWDLIIEGIVRPGSGEESGNAELPWFHVTDWGREALKHGPQTPYDPDGYLKKLRLSIPALDPVIETYLNESLRTFRINCLLSSTIALGCATEKALLLLIAAYRDSLPAARSEKFRKNTAGRMIKRQFEEFRQMLESDLRSKLPQNIAEGLDIELNGLFEIFRTQRNDAGHPTGKTLERSSIHANLRVVPVYLQKVYELIAWITANPKK
jgi:hypothetical protein